MPAARALWAPEGATGSADTQGPGMQPPPLPGALGREPRTEPNLFPAPPSLCPHPGGLGWGQSHTWGCSPALEETQGHKDPQVTCLGRWPSCPLSRPVSCSCRPCLNHRVTGDLGSGLVSLLLGNRDRQVCGEHLPRAPTLVGLELPLEGRPGQGHATPSARKGSRSGDGIPSPSCRWSQPQSDLQQSFSSNSSSAWGLARATHGPGSPARRAS